jgi:hypothetical protein
MKRVLLLILLTSILTAGFSQVKKYYREYYECELESDISTSWPESALIFTKENGGKFWVIRDNVAVQITEIWVTDNERSTWNAGGYDGDPTVISQDASHRFASDAEKTAWSNKQAAGNYLTAENNLSDVSNASTARTNLGLVIGTNVLAPNGSAALLTSNTGGWTELRVTGSNATTTGQVLVDITGLNSGALSNSTRYEIEAVLSVTTSAVTTGIQFGIGAGGSGGAAVVNCILTGTTTSAAATSQTINTAGTASSAMVTTSGASGTIIIKGYVTTRGSGTATISIQHLKVTSGTSTVLIGSVFRFRPLQ